MPATTLQRLIGHNLSPVRYYLHMSQEVARFDWRAALREHRRAERLSLAEVARRSGLSLSAVKSYESGRRHPSREALGAIIDAIGLTTDQANPILAGAGYAANWRAATHQAYGPRPLEWFAAEVERDPWPVFVTNEASDLVAANRVFRTLIGIHLAERLPAPQWNFVATASDPDYARRLESWDDSMRFMIGLAKGWPGQLSPERLVSFMAGPYQRFLEGDPALVTRMLQLWGSTEPAAVSTRMRYPVRWRHESGGLMRFAAVMTVADVQLVYSWHDWVPEDAQTWELLAGLPGTA